MPGDGPRVVATMTTGVSGPAPSLPDQGQDSVRRVRRPIEERTPWSPYSKVHADSVRRTGSRRDMPGPRRFHVNAIMDRLKESRRRAIERRPRRFHVNAIMDRDEGQED